jgi:hypothetical protein
VDERLTVRLESPDAAPGPPFRWARLGPTAARRAAMAAGLGVTESWRTDGRAFLALAR